MALTFVEYAKAVLYNGLAEYELAAVAAHSASSDDRLVIPHWPLPELVEAAMRSGQSADAAAACKRLSAMASASGTDSALGAAALARALVADGHVADELYRGAIDLLSRTRMASHLARARLCYGEWLRRDDRRVEADTQLRAAFDAFAAMGATPSPNAPAASSRPLGKRCAPAARTRRGIDPSRTSDRPARADTADQPEIGAELFLSERTVEWHLHNIFASSTSAHATNRRRPRSPQRRTPIDPLDSNAVRGATRRSAGVPGVEWLCTTGQVAMEGRLAPGPVRAPGSVVSPAHRYLVHRGLLLNTVPKQSGCSSRSEDPGVAARSKGSGSNRRSFSANGPRFCRGGAQAEHRLRWNRDPLGSTDSTVRAKSPECLPASV